MDEFKNINKYARLEETLPEHSKEFSELLDTIQRIAADATSTSVRAVTKVEMIQDELHTLDKKLGERLNKPRMCVRIDKHTDDTPPAKTVKEPVSYEEMFNAINDYDSYHKVYEVCPRSWVKVIKYELLSLSGFEGDGLNISEPYRGDEWSKILDVLRDDLKSSLEYTLTHALVGEPLRLVHCGGSKYLYLTDTQTEVLDGYNDVNYWYVFWDTEDGNFVLANADGTETVECGYQYDEDTDMFSQKEAIKVWNLLLNIENRS